MIKSFTTEVEGTSFEFVTMNVRQLQLFQVYVMHEGTRVRFHMQINNEGNFKITLPDACPEVYQALEPLLSAAILTHGAEDAA